MTARLLALLAALSTVEASAQAGARASSTLVGRVLDHASGAAVTGAEVNLSPDGGRLTTDSLGEFRAVGLAPGMYNVSIKRVGFRQFSDLASVGTGAESRHEFRIVRVVVLDTLETRAKGVTYVSPALRGFEERRASGFGKFISEAELRSADERTLANVLRRLPGITIRSQRSADYASGQRAAGSGQAAALTRAGSLPPKADSNDPTSPRGCWVAVYLDGVALYRGPPQPAPDLSQIPVNNLAGVEFYSGSASLPVQFSAIKASECGTLLLWTRER